jgi:hypothetical protein
VQNFKLTSIEYQQDINQGTTIHSTVTTKNSGGTFVNYVNHDWPLLLDITLKVAPDGSETQTTKSNQYFEADQNAKHNGQSTSFSLLKDRVITTDTLNFDASGNFTGNSNQSSSQNYFQSNSTGYCYSRDITAANNVLTSVTDGQGCN